MGTIFYGAQMAVKSKPRVNLSTALTLLKRYSSRRNRRIVAGLCAVTAALVTLTHQGASGQRQRIVVAQHAIAPGSLLEAADLTTVTVAGPRFTNALADPTAAIGRRVMTPLPAGSVIGANQLIGPALLENDDYSLVPLRLADPALSSVLVVGDWIDIFTTNQAGQPTLIASRVRVAALPPRATSNGFGTNTSPNNIVLVAIVRSLAGELAGAGASTQLSIALRASDSSRP